MTYIYVIFYMIFISIVAGIISLSINNFIDGFYVLNYIMAIIIIVLSSKFIFTEFKHLTLSELGIRNFAEIIKYIIFGIVIGSVLVFFYGYLTQKFYKIVIRNSINTNEYYLIIIPIIVNILYEELHNHAYPFFYLIKKEKYTGAILISSTFFSLLHMGDFFHPTFVWLNFIQLFFIYSLFGLLIVFTKSIIPAIGAHIGWNLIVALFLGHDSYYDGCMSIHLTNNYYSYLIFTIIFCIFILALTIILGCIFKYLSNHDKGLSVH